MADSTALSAGGTDQATVATADLAASQPPPSLDNAREARDLIGAATNSATGQVDTSLIAGQIADASTRDPEKASTAYTAVQNELRRTDPAAADRLQQDVVRAFSDSSKGAAPGLVRGGGEILKANPILTKQWDFTQSAWTRKAGPTPGLENLLLKNGIQINPQVRAAPPGSRSPSSGVPASVANNTNGALARDAIANDYRAQGLTANTEVPTQNGARRVDVQVQQPAADPRESRVLEIESKVGRVSNDADARLQVAKDAKALASNSEIRAAGRTLETAGKVLRPLAVAADAYQLGEAFHADGNTVGVNTGRTASGIAGGWGGAAAGAEGGAVLGAAVGSVVPVVGTAVGGVVGAIGGGIVGGIGGDWAGRHLFDRIRGWF